MVLLRGSQWTNELITRGQLANEVTRGQRDHTKLFRNNRFIYFLPVISYYRFILFLSVISQIDQAIF